MAKKHSGFKVKGASKMEHEHKSGKRKGGGKRKRSHKK